jgi:hypothetical protein
LSTSSLKVKTALLKLTYVDTRTLKTIKT